ncbi:FtsK/SpoIIIE domain-containing protein [Cellulosimicrobium sp. 72-3]|uniref:FtsK/SpoIIIE domain-containing protein n=1 Tax=Cellulosimicrobium sp. 72-3 TaxID=2731680 RepID=UPI00148ECAC1|nr:FtsK/SpoIIIE domain-containing protein [Cellulosimicrobium sp. 72-3]
MLSPAPPLAPGAPPGGTPAPGTDGGAWVRVTVHPGTDVLLAAGTRLGDARPALADLGCRPELRTAPLAVDGVPVDDDQRCGTRPLLPGATVTVVRAGSDPRGRDDGPVPEGVLAAPRHVAVLGGPDAGRLVAVGHGDRGRTRVDRLDVRWRTTRRGPRVRVRVPRGTRRVPDDAALLRARPARAGRRVGSWRAVRWRDGRALVTPDGAYALRARPALVHGPRSGPAVGPDRPVEAGRLGTAQLATALVPAVASIGLAVALRQPLLALLALVGPLAVLGPALAEVRRRRAAQRAAPSGAPPDVGAAPSTVPVDPLHPRPADVLLWATVARLAPGADLAGAGAAGALSARAGSSGAAPGTTVGTTSGGSVGAAGGGAPLAAPGGTSPSRVRLPDGCVAVVGPRDVALAAARALLVEVLASGAPLTVRPAAQDAPAWSWCRWLPHARAVRTLDAVAAADPPGLVVVDGPVPAGELARVWDRCAPAGTDVLLVLGDRTQVPAWCRTLVDVTGAVPVVTGPDGARTPREHVGVSAGWALGLARRLAAAEHLGRLGTGDGDRAGEPDPGDPTARSLPSAVALGPLLGAPRAPDRLATWVAERWQDAARRDGHGLRTVLGVGPGGAPVAIDLVHDGPHVLVAGTTGAGKSELLQTLVAGLALGRSPDELSFALVDFKGGASFGACGRLPHVVGQVTDLDPGLAGRALAGLRAELHRRERILAAADVASIDALPRGRLARLVVVVDEFRALADDLPDLVPGLLRVAAQGRSLGVHLVLATQRPAGAVSADVRANVTLRLALRVVDVADSRDVVDSPHAARVPASTPGRLVLRRGAEPPVAVQCARAGGPLALPEARVRLADPWGAGRGPCGPAPNSADDHLPLLVAAAREVAARSGLRAHPAPWLPALPARVGPDELARVDGVDGIDGIARVDGEAVRSDDRTLPVALGDLPALQRRTVVRWDPLDGHLAVQGRPRSGRTTALRTVGLAALDRGWAVHAIGSGLADLAAHPGTGTVVDRSDPRRVVRLLRLLAGHDDGQSRPAGLDRTTGRTLLLVDDVEAVRGVLAGVAGGAGADALADVLADSPTAVAVSASGPTVGGLASLVGVRAVLASRDRHDDVSLGVPAALAGQGGPPGRAVWLGPGDPLVCQVVLPPTVARGRSGRPAPPRRGAFRLHPLRDDVGTADLDVAGHAPGGIDAGTVLVVTDPGLAVASTDRDGTDVAPGPRPTCGPVGRGAADVAVGRGGDDGRTLWMDVARGALVVGPPGSGRTSTLALLARHAAATGSLRAVVSRDDVLASAAMPAPGRTARTTGRARSGNGRKDGRASSNSHGNRDGSGTTDWRASGSSNGNQSGNGIRNGNGNGNGNGNRNGAIVVRRYTPADVARLLDTLEAGQGAATFPSRATAPRVVVVDDLDVLTQLCVLEADRLAALCRDGLVLLASATTGAAASALRGPLADLRGARSGIVLAPRERGSAEVFGHGLEWLTEPGRPRPGRGVLVQGAWLAPLQVARP